MLEHSSTTMKKEASERVPSLPGREFLVPEFRLTR